MRLFERGIRAHVLTQKALGLTPDIVLNRVKQHAMKKTSVYKTDEAPSIRVNSSSAGLIGPRQFPTLKFYFFVLS